MARVKNPLNSAEASGLVGGLEYRQNRTGSVVGNRSISPHRITSKTSRVAYALKAAWAAWRALTPTQQASWGRYLDDQRDARQTYIGAYCRMHGSGYSLAASQPAKLDPGLVGTPYFYSWSAANRQYTVAFTPAGPTTFVWMISYLLSFRRMTNPDLRKFKWISTRRCDYGASVNTLPHLAPFCYFRCRLIQSLSGQVYKDLIVDGAPTWDAGPGDLAIMTPPGEDIITGPTPEDEPA